MARVSLTAPSGCRDDRAANSPVFFLWDATRMTMCTSSDVEYFLLRFRTMLAHTQHSASGISGIVATLPHFRSYLPHRPQEDS
eukprot:7893429-Pyramimonas_sp.AAC.1